MFNQNVFLAFSFPTLSNNKNHSNRQPHKELFLKLALYVIMTLFLSTHIIIQLPLPLIGLPFNEHMPFSYVNQIQIPGVILQPFSCSTVLNTRGSTHRILCGLHSSCALSAEIEV